MQNWLGSEAQLIN